MRIKKFRAGSMREALMLIRQELGEEAVILKTNRVSSGFLSLGGKTDIEVTAGVDDSARKTQAFEPIKVADPGVYGHPQQLAGLAQKATRVMPAVVSRASVAAPPSEPSPSASTVADLAPLQEIREDLRELKNLVRNVMSTEQEVTAGGFSGGWAILYRKLIESEVGVEVARKLVGDVRANYESADSGIDATFVAALAASFPVAGPLRPKSDGPLVVAMVGPTGAGKTTTLAKLAAHYVLKRQNSVSIITADTYRIAAIEQIRIFADIVGIGLQVVFSPKEVAEARTACENDDVVLVDTAGRSQRDKERMEELKAILEELKPDEIHLVLSATTKDSDLDDIVRCYGQMGVNRLLFTKLDETVKLGNILNTVASCRIPVSYFATGQNVPDDIEVAQATRYVQRLWEEVGR